MKAPSCCFNNLMGIQNQFMKEPKRKLSSKPRDSRHWSSARRKSKSKSSATASSRRWSTRRANKWVLMIQRQHPLTQLGFSSKKKPGNVAEKRGSKISSPWRNNKKRKPSSSTRLSSRFRSRTCRSKSKSCTWSQLARRSQTSPSWRGKRNLVIRRNKRLRWFRARRWRHLRRTCLSRISTRIFKGRWIKSCKQ